MKCPYCDVEMIPGFLNCGNTIWSERKHKISTLPGGKERTSHTHEGHYR